MELKLYEQRAYRGLCPVLIVPFMELKQACLDRLVQFQCGLNRTFYGIETGCQENVNYICMSLNRTFYGIETRRHEK